MMSTALEHEPAQDASAARRPWVIGLAGLAVVVLLAGSAFVLLRPGGSGSSPEQDPLLKGVDIARPPVTTKLAVFRGTEAPEADAFGQWLGRPVDYVVDFSSRKTWAEIAAPTYMLNHWKGTGYRPVYSVGLLPEEDDSASIDQGAAGAYDKYFRTLGRNLVAADQADAILRLGWEFNLDSSRWSTSDPKAFITYWRRVATTLRSVPGQRFEFDWNPNNGNNKYDAAIYYPGDDVVDYVGVDAYDVGYARDTYPYPSPCDSACRLKRQQNAWDKSIYGGPRGLAFWSRFAAHHGKPMSLPEWGLWIREDGHGGGENSYYLTKMHEFITNPANGVAYHSYFEFNGADGPHRLMMNFPEAGTTFRALFGTP
jgi:hypothetical protein